MSYPTGNILTSVLYNTTLTAQAAGNSRDIDVSGYRTIMVLLETTTINGTGLVTVTTKTKAANGTYFPLETAFTATAGLKLFSFGAGLTLADGIGQIIRIEYTRTVTATLDGYITVIGKS